MGKTKDSTVYKTTGWMGFGSGSNPAAIDIKDGKIARIRPMRLTDAYTEEQLNPWQLTVRGKTLSCGTKTTLSPLAIAYKNRIYSKNRVMYPMKRVDWDPNGERNPQNRGLSGYERISWDEATTIIASEIRRIIDTYGNTAVFVQGDGHGETKVMGGDHGANTHLMTVLGGFTLQARQPDSWEGWYWGAKHMWGMDPVGEQAYQSNLLMDISENSEAVIFVGCDPETTPWGWGGQMQSNICYFWHDIGIKQIYICPDVNYGTAVHADKWIPILPNTDAALWLAIAYVWLTEGTYESDYIKTHTDGFDWFERYVLGGEDGVPKTPKWAEEKCGVPSRQIKALARYWAKHVVSTAHCNGGGYIRSVFSHEPARLEIALLAMRGLGAPGVNQFKFIEWGLFAFGQLNPIPKGDMTPFKTMNFGSAFTGHIPGTNLEHFIPQTLVPNAIMLPEGEKLTWYGHVVAGLPREDQYNQYQYPMEGASRIHMFWTDTPCWSTCWNGGNRMQEALRDPSIEFMLAQEPWMENDMLFADIVLPITTKYEEWDIATSTEGGINDMFLNEAPAIEPVGESKSDAEAVLAIAEKLGVADKLMEHWCYPHSMDLNNDEEDDFIKQLSEEKYGSDSEYMGEPSFDTLARIAYRASGADNVLSYDEFLETGYIPVRFKDEAEWRKDPIGMREFYNDPEANPLDTPTGKIEFWSTSIHSVWPDDPQRPEVPHWIEESPQHHERLTNDRGKDYPFLMVSNHPRWRVHANGDDAIWLREISTCKVDGPDGYKYEPVWINPDDARERDIKDGDIVRIYNERGSVLGGALVTPRICRHAVSQDHGARVDSVVTGRGGLDRGGANNLICPGHTTSQNAPGEVTNGFLVNIEKVDVFDLAEKYPAQFNRDYDPADGLHVSAYIVKEA